MFSIYGLVADDSPSDIRYIGLTKNKLSQRLAQHKWGSNRLTHHAACWIKSKCKKISIVLLEQGLELHQALAAEMRYIAELKGKGYKLVNSNSGGNVYTNPEKVSVSMTGRIPSEETRKKLSLSHMGHTHTVEQKRKMREAHFDKPRVKILQLDAQGTVLAEWGSARIAHRAIGVNYKHVSACINNKRKTAGGFFWKKSAIGAGLVLDAGRTPLTLLMPL